MVFHRFRVVEGAGLGTGAGKLNTFIFFHLKTKVRRLKSGDWRPRSPKPSSVPEFPHWQIFSMKKNKKNENNVSDKLTQIK